MSLENLEQYSEEQRMEIAGHYYQDGQLLVNQAEQEQFENTETLQKASAAFIQSIKIYSKDARSYLSLANIFLYLEDFKTAEHYVESALKLNAYNVLAVELKKRILVAKEEKLSAQSEVSRHLPYFVPVLSDDYDLLYDEVEVWIQAKVRELMEIGLPPLALTQMSFQALKRKMTPLKKEYDEFLHILTIIDEQLDISDLFRMARPIEVYLERLQTLIFNSQRCLLLNQEIFSEAQILKRNIIKAENITSLEQISEMEEHLDIFLDKHEHYRNQLEELKRLKLPIHPILTKWHMLEQILDHYREVLDDAIIRFL